MTGPVIGVFGGAVEATLEPAERVGHAVVVGGSILLTGGGRRLDEAAVKEAAMRGASAAPAAAAGRRVGVLGVESTQVGIDISDSGVILEPNVGHQRNYLNAAMCDVAIAFPGGHGTDSEVVFALALGRPVVLVGEDWERVFPLSQDLAARGALVGSAQRRVRGGGRTELDALITRAYEAFPTAKLRVQRLPLDAPAEEIVSTARGLAEAAGLRGDFPELRDRPDLVGVARGYRDWLRSVGVLHSGAPQDIGVGGTVGPSRESSE